MQQSQKKLELVGHPDLPKWLLEDVLKVGQAVKKLTQGKLQ
jgi:hypothetical protein